MKKLLLAALLVIPLHSATAADAIDEAVAAPHRDAANVARDRFRHPAETLRFFRIEPAMTVVEIWPGGGWYTGILAPLLHDDGTLYLAVFSDTAFAPDSYQGRSNAALRKKLGADEAVYGKVQWTHLNPPAEMEVAPAGSADRVLTFRNVHNWLKAGQAENAFKAFFSALRPGGLLGVVEHRAKPGTSLEQMKQSGYVTEEKVKELARTAGFELIDSSEVNANPKDSADHPQGVWTLPPTYRMGGKDRAKYEAVGESDRMTLLFRKPESKD